MSASVRFEYKVLVDAEAEIRKAAGDALGDVADAGLEEANRTIPLEEGIMQDSGFTEVDRDALEAQIAYSTPYAQKQHEDVTLHHDPGREDHWLEKTVDRNRQAYADYIATEVRRRLGT
jgi:hypothetical protein